MKKHFNEQERINMLEIFDSFQFSNGVMFSCGNIQRATYFDIDLANKIFNDEINVKDISEKDYEEMFFAIEVSQEICICAWGAKDPLLEKFLELLKKSRNEK